MPSRQASGSTRALTSKAAGGASPPSRWRRWMRRLRLALIPFVAVLLLAYLAVLALGLFDPQLLVSSQSGSNASWPDALGYPLAVAGALSPAWLSGVAVALVAVVVVVAFAAPGSRGPANEFAPEWRAATKSAYTDSEQAMDGAARAGDVSAGDSPNPLPPSLGGKGPQGEGAVENGNGMQGDTVGDAVGARLVSPADAPGDTADSVGASGGRPLAVSATTSPSSAAKSGVATTTFIPRAFISHSSLDNEFGERLVARLRDALGSEDAVWYDSLPGGDGAGLAPGDEWWDRINSELNTRNVFLIILTPNSMSSKWCQDELKLAWSRKNAKTRSEPFVLIPLMLETCDPPTYLTTVQFANFTNPDRFEENVAHLLQTIRAGRTVEQSVTTVYGPPFDLAQLPLPQHFVGREQELTWLREHLSRGATTLGIVAVNGLGGIGKTGLAAKAVRDLRANGRFPDGIAVVLCQDKRSEDDALEILTNVLTRFDPQRRTPEANDPVGLSEVAQRLLLDKDALIVLDNVEPELPIGLVVAPLREAGATVLLTARSLLPADVVPPEGRLPLDLLSEAEALDLLAKSLGKDAASDLAAGELQAAKRIVASLDRHTLAVTLAGAYVADGRDLASLSSELADPRRALRLPKGNVPEAVKHAFLSSYDALIGDARRLFTSLAAFPTLNFSREAAAALGEGLQLADPETNVGMLARLALATSLSGDRLRLHPLIQALADAEFATWPRSEQNNAYLAVVRYYAAYSNRTTDAGREIDEDNIAGALVRAATLEQDDLVRTIAEGMGNYWRERSRSEAGARASFGERGTRREPRARIDEREFVRLANLAYSYAELQLHLGDLGTAERYLSQSIENYRASHQRREESLALERLGDVALQRGDLAKAEDCFDRVLIIMREVRDRRAEARAYSKLGDISLLRGDLVSAERHYEVYLVEARELRDRRSEAVALSRLGDIALRQGDVSEAQAHYEQALTMMRLLRDRRGEGVALSQLGDIALAHGDLSGAQARYERYLAIMREVGDIREEGVALSKLGDMAAQRGDLTSAQALYERYLAIMREVGDIREEGVSLSNLGDILAQRGDLAGAQANYERVLAIMREVGDTRGEGVALAKLGDILMRRGDLAGAQANYERVLAIMQEVGDTRSEAATLLQLGDIAQRVGDLSEAQTRYERYLAIMREVRDRREEGVALSKLGDISVQHGDLAQAQRLYEESLAIARGTQYAELERAARGNLERVIAARRAAGEL